MYKFRPKQYLFRPPFFPHNYLLSWCKKTHKQARRGLGKQNKVAIFKKKRMEWHTLRRHLTSMRNPYPSMEIDSNKISTDHWGPWHSLAKTSNLKLAAQFSSQEILFWLLRATYSIKDSMPKIQGSSYTSEQMEWQRSTTKLRIGGIRRCSRHANFLIRRPLTMPLWNWRNLFSSIDFSPFPWPVKNVCPKITTKQCFRSSVIPLSRTISSKAILMISKEKLSNLINTAWPTKEELQLWTLLILRWDTWLALFLDRAAALWLWRIRSSRCTLAAIRNSLMLAES